MGANYPAAASTRDATTDKRTGETGERTRNLVNENRTASSQSGPLPLSRQQKRSDMRHQAHQKMQQYLAVTGKQPSRKDRREAERQAAKLMQKSHEPIPSRSVSRVPAAGVPVQKKGKC